MAYSAAFWPARTPTGRPEHDPQVPHSSPGQAPAAAPPAQAPASAFDDSAQSVWLAGLGALASAQAEGSKAFESLVKQGVEMQTRAQQLTRERMEAMTIAGAAAPWNRLGGIFEDRVAQALAGMGMPSAQELAALTARVAALEKALLNQAPPASATPSKPRPAPRKRASSDPETH